MFRKVFQSVIAVVFLSTLFIFSHVDMRSADAGLDQDGKYDQVVALYYFENVQDSGPREFDGLLLGNASIVNHGKIGKCLQLTRQDEFVTAGDQHLGITDNEFSIVAWVKLPKQAASLYIVMSGIDEDESLVGAVSLAILPSGTLEGLFADFKDDEGEIIESKNHDVSDNQWHHIAYTKYAETHTLFVDGAIIERKRISGYLGFVADITVIAISPDGNLTGGVLIDEVGFFETGFSLYEISGLYHQGLTTFLAAMPVDPREKAATTWGALKRQW